MGLLDGLLGSASEIDASQLHTAFAQVLAPGERVEKAYQLVRDTFVFTDKRLIFVNRQGLTGRKVEYQSIPYRNIIRFSIETAGSFDLDAGLNIWLSGSPRGPTTAFSDPWTSASVPSRLFTLSGRCACGIAPTPERSRPR